MVVLCCCLGAAVFLGIGVLVTAYICYRMAFYAPPRKPVSEDTQWLPQGRAYEPYWDSIKKWTDEVQQMSGKDVSVTSFDGLTLRGKFFEYAPGAPVELLIHGYRGCWKRDMSGGVQRCFKLGRSALLVDQRGCGSSDGNTISFGINEHRDCLTWVEYIINNFGSDRKIILTGMSMGAATVMMAAGRPLPANVIGVLADCGYSSPKEIIQKDIARRGLPVKPAYLFVKLGARIFGHFRLDSYSPMAAMQTCSVPVCFVHGEKDGFVPCDMSRELYRACPTAKKLVVVPGADHGLNCLVNPELYYTSLREFFGEEASYY